ncbi:MAG: hypothetical protein O3C34_12030 [Proteobacteria bacterium]|nr:hypothetical protein [Pseudomonadota bacterium]
MPKDFLGKRQVRWIGAAALFALTCSGSVYAADCVAPRDRDSQIVRALQSRLMIAALSCNARNDYNQFVNHYQPQLAYHGTGLRKYFRKKHGKSHKRALNKFVTDLANGASQASIKDRSRFCVESRAIFAALKSASSRQAPLTLQAVALDTDWRHKPAKVCEAYAQRTTKKRRR